MGRWGHIKTWWDALVRPDKAAGVVLEFREHRGLNITLVALIAFLYASYGLTMGIYRGYYPGLVSFFKLPFLYLFTLSCCAPYIYVINSTIGPRLSAKACVRLLLIGLSANAVALASYGPFSFLFAFTTSTDPSSGYRFLILMHVAVFGLAGLASIVVIGAVFRAVSKRQQRPLTYQFIVAFAVLYALVGTQMAWTLRPWVGSWEMEYQPFRPIEGSFVQAVYRLLSGQ